MTNGYSVARSIRLRHIRCFIEVASERNVSRAAENLGTVQPALSRTLRELENILDTKLFDRTRGGLELTEAGQTFLKFASGGMSQIIEGVERLKIDEGRETVVLGAMPSVLRTLLPDCIRRFRHNHPTTTLRIVIGSNADLLSKLRSGRMDFAAGVTLEARGMEGLIFERLANEDLVFAVRPGHPLADSDGADFAQVDRFPIVVPLPRSPIRDDMDNYLRLIGAPGFSSLIETASVEFARAYAMADDAVVVFPRSTLQLEFDGGELRPLRFTHIHLFSPTGLVFSAARKLGPAARHLAETIREGAARPARGAQ